MTTILLIRHAQAAAPRNMLLGRNDDVGLSREGLKRAAALANNLRRLPIASVWSSPLRRAFQTATIIADELRLSVQIAVRLNELDYGRWTGCTFDQLEDHTEWRRFNTARGHASVPGGENMKDVEGRVAAQLENWRRQYPAEYVVGVAHAEIVRIAVLQTLGLTSNCYDKIEISPCSVSVLSFEGARARIICLNDSGQLDCLEGL